MAAAIVSEAAHSHFESLSLLKEHLSDGVAKFAAAAPAEKRQHFVGSLISDCLLRIPPQLQVLLICSSSAQPLTR